MASKLEKNANTKVFLKIIQISDFHLFANIGKNFLGINPYKTYVDAMLSIVNLYEKESDIPHLLVITGDISQDFSVKSYANAFELIEKTGLPFVVTAGNHDNILLLEEYIQKYSHLLQKNFTYNNWHIIVLNSHWHKHIAGLLNENELQKLQHELEHYKDKHIMIFLHHNVVTTNTAWLDQHTLQNADQFLTIIRKYKNVKVVFSGHVHQDFHANDSVNTNIDFYTTPALSWQFKPHTDDFQLDTKMPGYRIIELHEDGQYATYVKRLSENKEYIPDLTSTGY